MHEEPSCAWKLMSRHQRHASHDEGSIHQVRPAHHTGVTGITHLCKVQEVVRVQVVHQLPVVTELTCEGSEGG
jgi:hypothetical protein